MSEENETVESAEPVTLNDGEYFASEGVKGAGDKPDWYNSDKYTSVAEQAKAYPELQKQFGGFTGAPKDGYANPEGFDAEDAMLKTFTEYASDSNMSQANFDKGFELLTAQSNVAHEVSVEAELEKLGDNAEQRIDRANLFLQNNLNSDKYESIKEFVTTADAVKLVEMLIPATSGANLPGNEDAGAGKLTLKEVEEVAFKKDDNGNYLRSIDPAYDKKVMNLYAQLAN